MSSSLNEPLSEIISNAELIEFDEIQQKLDKWTIPKVDPTKISKNSYFFSRFQPSLEKNMILCKNIRNLLKKVRYNPPKS